MVSIIDKVNERIPMPNFKFGLFTSNTSKLIKINKGIKRYYDEIMKLDLKSEFEYVSLDDVYECAKVMDKYNIMKNIEGHYLWVTNYKGIGDYEYEDMTVMVYDDKYDTYSVLYLNELYNRKKKLVIGKNKVYDIKNIFKSISDRFLYLPSINIDLSNDYKYNNNDMFIDECDILEKINFPFDPNELQDLSIYLDKLHDISRSRALVNFVYSVLPMVKIIQAYESVGVYGENELIKIIQAIYNIIYNYRDNESDNFDGNEEDNDDE